METRRVQITGGASFMITLPKDWAESSGLKKNEKVGVEIQPDGNLLLVPNRAQQSVKHIVKVIDVSGNIKNDFLYRKLIGAYISGHNLIEVRSGTSISNEVSRITFSFTQASIGLEVIEEDNSHILIKDLMDHTEILPSKNVERIGVIVQKMVTDVFESASVGNISMLKGMDARDQEVDRIHWLVSRQSNIYQKNPLMCSKVGIELHKLTRHLMVSRIVERIGDHVVLVSNDLIALSTNNNSETIDKGLHEIGHDIVDLLNRSMKGWLSQDLDVAEKCIEKGETLVRKIEKAFEGNNTDLKVESAKNLIAGSSKRIAEYCIDISELTINAAMD